MTPILGILNDTDAPEARMLVVVWETRPGRLWQYVSPGRLVEHKTWAKPQPFQGDRFVPLAKFGRRAEFAFDGRLIISLSAEPCTATYPDGVPRKWQGSNLDVIQIRHSLAGHVMVAVQALIETMLRVAA